tara:strand:- start:11189 stop:11431 length:243 start_codon:yes stop_codon:yes gene_type:complete
VGVTHDACPEETASAPQHAPTTNVATHASRPNDLPLVETLRSKDDDRDKSAASSGRSSSIVRDYHREEDSARWFEARRLK